jgi:ABC-2 type transport system ATP-binding protein
VTAILDIRSLSKVYADGVRVNDDISLRVNGGEVLGLLGHNGAGKTTLVRQVVGLSQPTRGSIWVAGVDVVAQPRAAQRLCSMQPQATVPTSGLTPRNAIQLIGRIRGLSAADAAVRTTRLTERLQIDDWSDRSSYMGDDKLTGGVRRLISFCMTVVAPGPLIVLDEPTNDVDPVRRRLLWEEVRRLASQGHAIVLVTHNVTEAERSVDRVAIMSHGRLVAEGTPASLSMGIRGQLRVNVIWATTDIPALPDYLISVAKTFRGFSGMVDRRFLGPLISWGDDLQSQGLIEHFLVGTAGLEDVYTQLMDNQALINDRVALPGSS